jgi:glycosyltransferase involved in cell wall biosynthesis
MGDKKVIIELITDLNVGGAEKMFYDFLVHFDRTQFDLIVIALVSGNLKEKIESLGIPVYVFDMKRGRANIFAFFHLFRRIRTIRPHLIHGWMYHANIVAVLASIFSHGRVPCIWSIHGSITSIKSENKITAAIIKFGGYLSNYPKLIHFVSVVSAKQHYEIGYRNSKTVVVPNGFDTDIFRRRNSTFNALRDELNINSEAVLVGLIGRFHHVKDHGNFLESASLLLKKRNNVHFILVGRDIDKRNRFIGERINRLNLTNYVHLLGEREDIPMITSSLDIACSASYSEAFSMAIGEAMSCEVSCVVTDVGDSKAIVGDTGMVVPPRDPEAFANALMELIDLGPEGRVKLGDDARKRIIENFSIHSIVDKFKELYHLVSK